MEKSSSSSSLVSSRNRLRATHEERQPDLPNQRSKQLQRRHADLTAVRAMRRPATRGRFATTHQPVNTPTHLSPDIRGDEPQRLQQHAATHHLVGQSIHTKASVFAAWSLASAMRGSGAGMSAAELGPVGGPFAALAFLCQMYDVVSTHRDLIVAREDAAEAVFHLLQQQAELEAVNARGEADPQLVQMLEFNIALLAKFVDSHDASWVNERAREQFKKARADARALMPRLVDIQQRLDEATQQRLADDLPDEQATALEREIDHLKAEHESMRQDINDRLSIKGMKRAAQAALQAALDNPEASTEEIAALRADTDLFKTSSIVKNTLFHPFDGTGSAQLKHIRDVFIQAPRSVIDGAINSTAFAMALQGVSLVAELGGAQILTGVIGMYSARADVLDGRRDVAKAKAAKIAALSQITFAAGLYHDCVQSHDRDVQACASLAWTFLRCNGRALRAAHRGTNLNQVRIVKGANNLVGGLVSLGSLIGAIATATSMVGVPISVVLAANFAFWFGCFAANHHANAKLKEKMKSRQTALILVLQRYGVQGLIELHTDRSTTARSFWTQRLQTLQDEAKRNQLEAFEPRELSYERLLENEYVWIEILTNRLSMRDRRDAPTLYAAEIKLVSALAQQAGKLDPTQLPVKGYVSAHAREAAIREALCQLFGAKNHRRDRLPMLLEETDANPTDQTPARHLEHLRVLKDPAVVGHYDAAYDFAVKLAADPGLLNKAAPPPPALEQIELLRNYLSHHHRMGPAECLELQHFLMQAHSPNMDETHRAILCALLELLANPSWLENVPSLPSDVPLDPSRATATAQLAKLVLAGKNLGEWQRAHKPPPWASEPTIGPGLPANPSDPPGRLRRRTVGAARKAKRGAMSLVTHARERLPNALATPERVADKLLDASARRKFELHRALLRQWVFELHGRDARLSDHWGSLPAMLNGVRAAAEQSLHVIEEQMNLRSNASRSLSRMRHYFLGVMDVCDELRSALTHMVRPDDGEGDEVSLVLPSFGTSESRDLLNESSSLVQSDPE